MSKAVGDAGERRAADYLQQIGYKILARNYACRLGEIDLVCEDGETLCFVEVRFRRRVDRFGAAIETITPEKRRRVLRAARDYMMRHSIEERECRFDVVTIEGDGDPKLVRNAFEDFIEF